MKIIWQDSSGKTQSWEGDFSFKAIGTYVRVTDKRSGKVHAFYCPFDVIQDPKTKRKQNTPDSSSG